MGQHGAQSGAGDTQFRTGDGDAVKGAGGEDQQGVEHHVQNAHHHHKDAGRAHIAAGLEHAAADVGQLDQRQRQGENKKVIRGVGVDGRICPEPARQRHGDGGANGHEQRREEKADGEALLHQVPGVGLIPGADALGHLHRKGDGGGGGEPAEEPGGGGHQPDGGGVGGAETAHHGRVDILHDDGGELGQDGRDAQPQRQRHLLLPRQLLSLAQPRQMVLLHSATSFRPETGKYLDRTAEIHYTIEE